MDNMIKVRMFYHKKGRAKYISHLDINRLMQRVLKRAKLPVWYTEGFNPHMYITFALPLSLGYESEAEYMDFRLTEEMDLKEVAAILNQNMPEGISVTKVETPICKFAEICSAEYQVTLRAESDAETLKAQIEAFLSSDRIEVVKKTKRGTQTVDLKPDIQLLSLAVQDQSVVCSVRLPAGSEKNYNPSLLFDELISRNGVKTEYQVLRKAVYVTNGQLFA
ncbi:MAG: DUF2344 domain-containing protein [Oscillospiraceae bacterium]|nr:DUF2344 domain-containing protein [Oscillospiraceae bacterium]